MAENSLETLEPHGLPAGFMFQFTPVALALIAVFLVLPTTGSAQYGDLTASPVTSTAPTGAVSNRDRHMTEVRRSAQAAQGEAAAASMARSADRTMDRRNLDEAVSEARELRAIKREAAERLRWERSNSRVRKVSANDMSSWETESGNVRVERDVPNAFIASLIAEEEEAMRRGTLKKKEKKRFSPASLIPSPRNLNPFKKDKPAPVATEVAATEAQMTEDDGGLFSKVRLPRIRIPKLGNREEASEGPPPEAPVFRSTGSGSGNVRTAVTAESTSAPAAPEGRVVEARSGAALVDGAAAPTTAEMDAGSDAAATSPQLASYTPQPQPQPEKERGGFFSGLLSSNDSPSSQADSLPDEGRKRGGLFSFGKKKESQEPYSVDASLFPTGAAEQTPTGGSLAGGYTAEDVARDSTEDPSSTGSMELPGDEGRKKRFSLPKPSLPKPDLSLPSLAGNSGETRPSSVPTTTTINRAGNDYYVVTDTAQFMVYGEEQNQSEVRALGAGNVVRMTRAGEQWASIKLSDGSEGVVQNKYLRAASAGEASPSFSAAN